jgi:hypothetical protein
MRPSSFVRIVGAIRSVASATRDLSDRERKTSTLEERRRILEIIMEEKPHDGSDVDKTIDRVVRRILSE